MLSILLVLVFVLFKTVYFFCGHNNKYYNNDNGFFLCDTYQFDYKINSDNMTLVNKRVSKG